MAKSQNGNKFTQGALRFAFVAFLFSYAIGQLAYEAFPVATAILSNRFSLEHLARTTHLLVAFLVITFSWVYWSKNAWPDNQLNDILTWNYWILATDVLLVVLYIFIVKSADLAPSPATPTANEHPSARPESMLLAGVYIVYLVWDILHDLIRQPLDKRRYSSKKAKSIRIRDILWALFVHCYASLFSVVLALFIVFVASCIEPDLHSKMIPLVLVVVLLNLAEIANLFVFRTSKVWEKWLSSKFWKLHPYFDAKTPRPEGAWHQRVCFAALTAYVALLLGVLLVWLAATNS